MKNRTWVLAALSLLAFTPGCFWLRSAQYETGPVAVDKPSSPERGEAAEPASADRRTEPVPASEVDVSDLPRPVDAAWSPTDPHLVLLPGGLRVAAARWQGTSPAHLSLTIAHRRLSAADIGLARLTAELLADAPLEAGTRPSLRRDVERAGGTFRIDVGPMSTRFAITVQPYAWPRVLHSLADAILERPTSVGRVEEIRTRLVRELSQRWADDPLAAAIERVQAFEFEGLPQWLERLEDARLDDVQEFHRDNYLPSRAIAVVATPNHNAKASVEMMAVAFETWTDSSTVKYPSPVPSVDPAAGVFWGTAESSPQVAAVVDLLPAAAPGAAASWILAHCLIGDSVDGRLARALANSADPPLLHATISETGIRRRIALSGTVRPDQVDLVRRTVTSAVRSLKQDPPGDEEIQLAAARARLRLMLDAGEPPGWAATVTRSVLAGSIPDTIVDREGAGVEIPGGQADALTQLADALERPDGVDLAPAIDELAGRGGLFVALGVDLSETPSFARMPDAVIPPRSRSAAMAELEEQEASAREVLGRAVRALGGRAPLLGFGGFHAVSHTRSGRGPQVVDHEWFRVDGHYRRVRHVLASVIETVVEPDGGTESCDGQTAALEETAAQVTTDALRRHPLALVAGWARGESTYRMISQREIHGRAIAVLERVDGEPGGIRLLIDEESGLPRAVIAREDRENGAVWIREELRDYRGAGRGLRAPHHRITWIDDGVTGLVTIYSEIDAETPELEWLQPGGPTR